MSEFKYCPKCGTKMLADDRFCTKCGFAFEEKNQIQVAKCQTPASQNTGKISTFGERVESSQDPAVNAQLFDFYSKLIAPVRKLENMLQTVNEIDNSIESNKIVEGFGIWHPFLCVILWILWIALYLITTKDDVSKVPLFGKLINSLTGGWMMLAAFAFVFLPPILAIIIIHICSCIVSSRTGKRQNEELARQREVLVNAIQDMTNKLSKAMRFVPPACRNSDALSFMVDAYRNSRVDNLKEAVNDYQRHIEHKTIIIENGFDGVAYSTMMTANQIALLNADMAFWGALNIVC